MDPVDPRGQPRGDEICERGEGSDADVGDVVGIGDQPCVALVKRVNRARRIASEQLIDAVSDRGAVVPVQVA